MTVNINTNVPSLRADREINSRSNSLSKSYEKLSSGKAINRASDDPAGLAVALELLANADTSSVALRNINDGVSISSIADGALATSSDITTRLAELATQSANGTLSDNQRSALNQEYQALRSELDRISQTTEFNGQQLLSQGSSFTLQAGIDGSANSQVGLPLPGVSASSLGLASDISTRESALAAVEETKAAVNTISEARGQVGSTVSRLETAYENLKTSEVNARSAASRIIDADVASESSKLIASRIGLEAGLSVKAQANQVPTIAQKLLS